MMNEVNMKDFCFHELDIEGSYLIQSFFSEDIRGSFIKNFEKSVFENNGISFNCTEDFITHSAKRVIRGMHFQLHHPQIKLVGVIQGEVYDVIIDLRRNSATYGKWKGVYLSSENYSSLLIPKGCAHGFLSLTDDTVVHYKCDGAYDKNTDMGIAFDDPDIGIEWPINDLSLAILNSRDKEHMSFQKFGNHYEFIY